MAEENLQNVNPSSRRLSRRRKMGMWNVFSIPSFTSYKHLRSSTCPSRFVEFESDRNLRTGSLRSISTPSRNFLPGLDNVRRFASLMKSMSFSTDIKSPTEEQRIIGDISTLDNQHTISSNSEENFVNNMETPIVSNVLRDNRITKRVGRSMSSPEGLQPVGVHRSSNHWHQALNNLGNSVDSSNLNEVQNYTNTMPNRNENTSISDHLYSRQYIDDSQDCLSSRSSRESYSPIRPNASTSFDSSLYSSRTSVRGRYDSDSTTTANMGDSTPSQRQSMSSFLDSRDPSFSFSNRRTENRFEDGPRLSQLALAHLTSRDLSSLQLLTPPPSYEKLCNMEALPSYQEAVQVENGRRTEYRQRRRAQFMLPRPSFFHGSVTNPLLEDSDRAFSRDFFSSLEDFSDSEVGFNTILDAIPCRSTDRDTHRKVPIRFASRWTVYHYYQSRRRFTWFASVCNKALVRKEVNKRWPFVSSVKEDERCLGLLFVECFANDETPQLQEDIETNPSIRRNLLSPNLDIQSTSIEIREQANSNVLTATNDEVDASQHIMFYLCGKCVAYDSFDAENVRAHIEYHCIGSSEKIINMSEFYLAVRALGYITIVLLLILVFIFQHL